MTHHLIGPAQKIKQKKKKTNFVRLCNIFVYVRKIILQIFSFDSSQTKLQSLGRVRWVEGGGGVLPPIVDSTGRLHPNRASLFFSGVGYSKG